LFCWSFYLVFFVLNCLDAYGNLTSFHLLQGSAKRSAQRLDFRCLLTDLALMTGRWRPARMYDERHGKFG
jgi:hypothetical protein